MLLVARSRVWSRPRLPATTRWRTGPRWSFKGGIVHSDALSAEQARRLGLGVRRLLARLRGELHLEDGNLRRARPTPTPAGRISMPATAPASAPAGARRRPAARLHRLLAVHAPRRDGPGSAAGLVSAAMFEKLAAHFRSSDTDYRLLVPLLVSTMLVQLVTAMVRVTTSYRAVELNLSIVWLGLIAATFAICPILIAVRVGRQIDRGYDAQHHLARRRHLRGRLRGLRALPRRRWRCWSRPPSWAPATSC